MKKNIIIVEMMLLCVLGSLPITIGNPSSNEDYSLKVYLEPMRYSFPRVYGGNGQPVGFVAGAVNEGPENSPGFTLKFEVIGFSKNDPYDYNTTMGFNIFSPGSGQGRGFTWHTVLGSHIRIYEARVTIDVDDANPADNMISYYFITLPLRFL